MGQIWVNGPAALSFLQKVNTNDVSRIRPGKAIYSHLPNEKGGVVDDVIISCLAEGRYLIVVNAATAEKDFHWLKKHSRGFDVELVNQSEVYGMIAVQGPRAAELVGADFPEAASLPRFGAREQAVFDQPSVITRTGYTGEDGFELFCKPEDAVPLWDALLEAGSPEKVIPCGLGARDSLRTEMKYCLYGNDIDDDTTPLEAGLGWIVKLAKAEGFVGQEVLAKQKAAGIPRKLIGFTLTDKGIPRHGYPVSVDGTKVSDVRSGTMSPTLKIPIGLCYLPTAKAEVGSQLSVEIRGRAVAAKVVPTPFYKRLVDR
jgi:aminomethyltransferase